MSLAVRLERIEAAAGVTWPCWMCEARRERDEQCYSFLTAHGIAIRRPKERDVLTLPCVVCDEPIRYDFTGYSTDEREAQRRINYEEILYRREGRLPSAEIVKLLDWLMERRRVRGRERYGAVFEEMLAEIGYDADLKRHQEWKRRHGYSLSPDEHSTPSKIPTAAIVRRQA
jgi:hypothetical protein